MKASQTLSSLIRQIVVFCGVGALNTALSLFIILLLSEGLHVHYVIANLIGYGCGLLSGFAMHKNLTFRDQLKDQSTDTQTQMAVFFLVFGIAYGAQLGLLVVLIEKIHLSNMPAQIMAWGFYVALSFVGHKFMTFRNCERGSEK